MVPCNGMAVLIVAEKLSHINRKSLYYILSYHLRDSSHCGWISMISYNDRSFATKLEILQERAPSLRFQCFWFITCRSFKFLSFTAYRIGNVAKQVYQKDSLPKTTRTFLNFDGAGILVFYDPGLWLIHDRPSRWQAHVTAEPVGTSLWNFTLYLNEVHSLIPLNWSGPDPSWYIYWGSHPLCCGLIHAVMFVLITSPCSPITYLIG